MNNNIIQYFLTLKLSLKDEQTDLIKKGNIKLANIYNYKIKTINRLLYILKNYNKKITLDNVHELDDYNGIGSKTIDKIINVLKSSKQYINPTKQIIINNFKQIIGIGDSFAYKLYNSGIYSITELKKQIKEKKIKINKIIEVGLKYHNKYKQNIPRSEIDSFYLYLTKIFNKLNNDNNYSDNNKYIFEICGSYRRQNAYSNDIDILVSKVNNNKLSNNLEYIIEIFNKILLKDNITFNKTKYSGFLKYNDYPIRRIDILFVKYNNYYPSLLYFTGSVNLNILMRKTAKKLNYNLSQNGIHKINSDKYLTINSEQDIFKLLDMKYLEPYERNI